MKITSSYGVEIKKQNICIRKTLEVFRRAVAYLVPVYDSVYPELEEIAEKKRRFNAAEHLVHSTKGNTARFDFDRQFAAEHYVMPVFYRDVMYREAEAGEDAAYLKLYDGRDWVWNKVRLLHTDMEYLRRHWAGGGREPRHQCSKRSIKSTICVFLSRKKQSCPKRKRHARGSVPWTWVSIRMLSVQ